MVKIEFATGNARDLPPVYRVFVNNGNRGCHDIRSLDELEFIASEELRVMTPLGQETSVTLRVIRLSSRSGIAG